MFNSERSAAEDSERSAAEGYGWQHNLRSSEIGPIEDDCPGLKRQPAGVSRLHVFFIKKNGDQKFQ